MNIFDVFIRPVITEKATGAEKEGKYQFFVRQEATRIDIKIAFQKLYGVAASKVNVLRTSEKTRSSGRRRQVVKRHSMKKVIITTKAKKTIDISKPKFKS